MYFFRPAKMHVGDGGRAFSHRQAHQRGQSILRLSFNEVGDHSRCSRLCLSLEPIQRSGEHDF